jgi:hypothetical protein
MVAMDDRLGNYTSGMVISLQIAGIAWRPYGVVRKAKICSAVHGCFKERKVPSGCAFPSPVASGISCHDG